MKMPDTHIDYISNNLIDNDEFIVGIQEIHKKILNAYSFRNTNGLLIDI